MEATATILGAVAADAVRFFCCSIYSSIRRTVEIQSNMRALEKETKNLIALRDDVKSRLAQAEKEDKFPATLVKKWRREVQDFEPQVCLMQEGMTANCSQRYRLGRKVANMLKHAKQLIDAGNFPTGIHQAESASKRVEYIPALSIQDQITASKTLTRLRKLLCDDGVGRIGIWGMGGVGKTTLVKNLNNSLKRDSLTQPFATVMWATVSKELDLKRVQAQIAERLNLEVKMDESVERLGIRLHERLVKENKFLLILDDVWEKIDLDLLGVPRPEDHKGSKIILTSRNLGVCMAMKTDVEVRVDVLSNEEAWQLFKQNAGAVASSDHIKTFAKAIAKECKGLPLAIITMATAMRGKTMVELWKHALNELKRSVPSIKGVEDDVSKPVKWSYDNLDGKNTKSCFLYCSLFPEDFSVEVSELVQCWLAEGLIEEQEHYEDSINGGIALIETLKDYCLLEDGVREGTVKLHDVVRDVAIWIASSLEDRCKSLVRSGAGLSKISENDLTHSLRRISFMNNKLTELPDCETRCSESLTLLLQGNSLLDKVPDKFLNGFPALKVLNLSGTRLQSLPLSFLQLHDLRALLLRDCYYLKDIPPLGGLSKLQALDLCATSIRKLPRGMKNLRNLRQLNLSRTHYLKTIKVGVICRLPTLEVLDMTLSNYHWAVKGQEEEGETNFEELGCLERLIALSIRLESIPTLGSEDLTWIKRLRRFQFFIGPTANSLPTKNDKRRVTISGQNLSGEWIDCFLINASSLVLNHCWGLNEMLETLVINSVNHFAGIKSLTIASSNSSLRPGGGCVAHDDLLPNLEELHLHNLTYLESISQLVGYLGLRFLKLKLMDVSICPRLKYLIHGYFILDLPNLEEIKVSFCDNLVELFNFYSEQNFTPEPAFPNLKMLELKYLPKLRNFCRQKESWQGLEQVEVIKCNLLRRLPLTADNANTIREIRWS